MIYKFSIVNVALPTKEGERLPTYPPKIKPCLNLIKNNNVHNTYYAS